jgi:small subunit ribosomal protein S17
LLISDLLECKDVKCPIHGALKTRGYEFECLVVSDKAHKTVIVKREHTIFLHKYERSLRKTSRIPAYNPDCIGAKNGDKVMIAETRRLSKTKSFVVTKIVKGEGK